MREVEVLLHMAKLSCNFNTAIRDICLCPDEANKRVCV